MVRDARALLDLYADGDLGLWALEHLASTAVGRVFTTNAEVARRAVGLGFDATTEDPHDWRGPSARYGLSVHYHALFRPEVIDRHEALYNVHPGYLPWGRGYYPVVWAIVEGEPAGATLHQIDAGIDTGPIVAQRRVEVSDVDTGHELLERVRVEERALILELLAQLSSGIVPEAVPQSGAGSYHDLAAFRRLRSVSCLDGLTAEQLVTRARALTHPDHRGLLIERRGGDLELLARSQDAGDG